jgi:hypothetical protein
MTLPLPEIIVAAGVGQIALAAASPAIPRLLNWNAGLAPLQPLLRQMFWVYAGYILITNLCFGLVSAFAPEWLLDGSRLANAVVGFIAVYWLARIVIQFTYFDRKAMVPPGAPWHQRWGTIGIELLFVYLAAAYGLAFAAGVGWF